MRIFANTTNLQCLQMPLYRVYYHVYRMGTVRQGIEVVFGAQK